MADSTQYTFDLQEATVALIKHQDLHEGLWTIGFEISMGAGLFGPTPAEAKPGAFMQVSRVQLIRQTPGALETSKFIDAAEINPQTKSRIKPPRR
jgi:hypothetical protein